MTDKEKICRICLQPMHAYPMGEKNGYAFVACSACGSVIADPWPEQAELDKFFGDVQPEIVHTPQPEEEIARLKKLIAKIAGPAAGRRFLDVSCRQGYAVIAAKELGFQAKGIDPHDFFIAFAKDKYDAALFEHVSVKEYAARNQQADVIFAVEPFCEQLQPEEYAAGLGKILAPQGLLYLSEPDGNSFHLPRKFTSWAFVDPPLNFSYISKKGMTLLLRRHGMKINKALFTWSPFMRLLVTHK